MGFETITAQIIFISALLYFGALIITTFNASWTNVHDSLKVNKDIMKIKLDERIEIDSIVYDNGDKKVIINVTNDGKTRVEIDYIDIYINETRIPRLAANRTIEISSDSELKNPGLWDPKELAIINISKKLKKGDYFVEIFTKNGNYAIQSFRIE